MYFNLIVGKKTRVELLGFLTEVYYTALIITTILQIGRKDIIYNYEL